jgi:hypothetical protein
MVGLATMLIWLIGAANLIIHTEALEGKQILLSSLQDCLILFVIRMHERNCLLVAFWWLFEHKRKMSELFLRSPASHWLYMEEEVESLRQIISENSLECALQKTEATFCLRSRLLFIERDKNCVYW